MFEKQQAEILVNNRGENNVVHELKKYEGTYLVRNLYIPFRSSDKEIDMAWITPYGIFSLEVKKLSDGSVLTVDQKTVKDRKWKYEGHGITKTNAMYNPIIQSIHNEKLIRSRLFFEMDESMRAIPLNIQNFIVFAADVRISEDLKDRGIITLDALMEHYENLEQTSEKVYDPDVLKTFRDILIKYSDMTVKKHNSHAKFVKDVVSDNNQSKKGNPKRTMNGSQDHNYIVNKKKLTKMNIKKQKSVEEMDWEIDY